MVKRNIKLNNKNHSAFYPGYFDPNNEIEVYYGQHGNLPHIIQEKVWFFVTFRLADAIPLEKIIQLKIEKENWLKNHNIHNLTKEEKKEYYTLFSEQFENWLNAGYGCCILRNEKVSKMVSNSILYFNNIRYRLNEWVIMPNHIHILIKPIFEFKLYDIMHSLKSYTAHNINKIMSQKGKVWMHESYDHIVRNDKALEAIRYYIRMNPVVANIELPDYCCSWKI